VAKYESSFRTNTTFDEAHKRNVRKGRINPKTYSQGLFQLSYASAAQPAYKDFCRFDWKADRRKVLTDKSLTIYDPQLQMDCAVGIMNYLVTQNGAVGYRTHDDWKGGARFWSTLRSNNPATALVRKSLKRYTPCWK
jgi:hypothetical protein